MIRYTLRIFQLVEPEGDGLNHREIATYEGFDGPPWVPQQGSFFRFRDPGAQPLLTAKKDKQAA